MPRFRNDTHASCDRTDMRHVGITTKYFEIESPNPFGTVARLRDIDLWKLN